MSMVDRTPEHIERYRLPQVSKLHVEEYRFDWTRLARHLELGHARSEPITAAKTLDQLRAEHEDAHRG